MDWLKWSKGLAWKPEILSMSVTLNLDRWSVAARCMELWEWADDNTENGNASRVTRSLVDSRAGITGFADAMIAEGWLIIENNILTFTNFDRHNSKSAKSRALTQKRVQEHRNVSVTLRALPEKRREEKNSNTPLPPKGGGGNGPDAWGRVEPQLAEPLRNERFRVAWESWAAYRRETKHRLTFQTIARQAKDFSSHGLDASVAAIEQSIGAGWRKLVFHGSVAAIPPKPKPARGFTEQNDPIFRTRLQEWEAKYGSNGKA